MQDALVDAATQWPADGIPDNQRAWLTAVAGRRLMDRWKSEEARRRREHEAQQAEYDATAVPEVTGQDESLQLLFLCCHPTVPPASAIPLTLRAVGGLSTSEIARAFLVPDATIAQRISRAKQRIKNSGVPFRMPSAAERDERLRSVLHILYLIFNEGYAPSTGAYVARVDLSSEAIRLARGMHCALPNHAEVAGLLALMLLTDARRPARTGPDGELVPLLEQDRAAWDRALIAEGLALITATLSRGAVGPYQVQAAIAAVHDESPTAAETDWPQILALYGVLERIAPGPMVTLNRAVAVAIVEGPAAGLALLGGLDSVLPGHHRLAAVRAHLLELAGDREGAVAQYRNAARRTTSVAERRYLTARGARLISRAGG